MLEESITQLLFYAFALCAIIAAIGVVIMRNPVSSAMCMAICFGFVAAIFFGLGAEFLGIIQITVYAGAVLVLVLFIVMMLDIKSEEKATTSLPKFILCALVAASFAVIVGKVAYSLPGAAENRPCPMIGLVDGICAKDESCCEKGSNSAKETPSTEAHVCALYASHLARQDALKTYGSTLPELKEQEESNIAAIGSVLFTKYPITFAILSLTLLASCIGAIAISRQLRKD